MQAPDDRRINPYVGYAQMDSVDRAVEDIFTNLKSSDDPFVYRFVEKTNAATNTNARYLSRVYPSKRHRMIVISLVLGLVTGAALSSYWTSVASFLTDIIVGFVLYIWCSIRVIPQNPPI